MFIIYLTSLIITVVAELAISFFVWFKRKKKFDLKIIFVINIISHPIATIIFIFINLISYRYFGVNNIFLGLIIAETFVVLLEAVLIRISLNCTYKESFLISFVNNLFSVLVGNMFYLLVQK